MNPLHTPFLSGWKRWERILPLFYPLLGFAVGYGLGAGPVMAQSIPPSINPPDTVAVTSPPNCSDISGNTLLSIHSTGMMSVKVRCWKQGPGLGADSLVGTIIPDADGNGSLTFPANDYPHGPITVRFSGENGRVHSNYYLQLYNKSGVSWNEGIPPTPPPAAAGLSLVFADDFDKPLSVSSTDPKAVYYDHKPGGGDFGIFHFANCESPNNPFAQIDTYLRIRANAKTQRDGLLSSIKKDGTGFEVRAPCYFECRLIAPSAPGTWPAFWLMTNYLEENPGLGVKGPADELDVIEAYGGEGPHNPNSKGEYCATTHFWNQGPDAKKRKHASLAVPLRTIGGGSSWWETFHTYGCKITETDTIYYCDDIEVARDPTGPVSRSQPFFFMINLAIGGNGWPVDLSRCQGVADMYVDYIRVYGAANGSPAP